MPSFLLQNFLHFLSYRSLLMSRILLFEKEIDKILASDGRPASVYSRQFLLLQQPFNPSLSLVLQFSHNIRHTRGRIRCKSEVNSFKEIRLSRLSKWLTKLVINSPEHQPFHIQNTLKFVKEKTFTHSQENQTHESLRCTTFASYTVHVTNVRSRVQTFPAWHTKAAPNGKCSEGYIVPSMVRLMYQLKSVLK